MDDSVTKSLLAGLSGKELEDVLSAFVSRRYQAGDTIIQMGDEDDELFLIITGKVRVWTGDGPNRSERTLSILEAGDHFGEASLLTRGKRTATVTALTMVETLVMSGEDYRQLLERHPQLLQNISRSLSSRLSSMNDYVSRARNEHQRGIHSLAIAIEHPAGWPLACAVLAQIRDQGQIVSPFLVSDEPVPNIEELGAGVSKVTVAELARTVASNSQDECVAVVIAKGDGACEAAIQECERVICVVDAAAGLNVGLGKKALTIPEHRRPIVAFLFQQDVKSRSSMQDDRIRCIPVRYEMTASNTIKLDSSAIRRLRRALYGIRIGLALGGGGARGISHIGVLEVFAKHGIVFDSLAGTSAGAIVASAFASGFSPAEIGDFFRKEMIPPKFMSRHQTLRFAHLFHSFRGTRFETKLRRYMARLEFDELTMPLAISTVDLISGQQKIRRSGDVVNAILESINHPVFGAPIVRENEILVDGGVLINVPASVLRSEGCDHVVSIDVGSSIDEDFSKDKHGKLRRPSYIKTLLRTMDIGRRHSSELHRDESDLIIFPKTSEFAIEDFHAVDALIDVGRAAGEAQWAAVEELILSIEPSMI